MKILVTGSEGLIGRTLCPMLLELGHEIVRLDSARNDPRAPLIADDVTNIPCVTERMEGCAGVIHLAACSRVVWGERDPFKCALVNVYGTLGVVAAARNRTERPWVLFASSREVYGPMEGASVQEDMPRMPINTYAYTKALGEDIVLGARAQGLATGIVRLSSVYGDTQDHADRVAPAFARAAAQGSEIRVRGSSKTFDFVHVHDAARGLVLAADVLAAKRALPTVHLVTGKGTTLGRLASIASSTAVALQRGACVVTTEDILPYEVTTFVGDPSRAKQVLGWEAEVKVEEGFGHLVRAFLAAEPPTV